MLSNRNDAPIFIVSESDAVRIKLMSNYLLAAKTIIVHDILQNTKLSSDVIEAVKADARIGNYGFDTSDGFGAGGKCLIKDLHLFDFRVDESEITKLLIERNYELLQLSNKDPELTNKYRTAFNNGDMKNA
jgi:UDP-glucose 6-dehydrogenase